MSKPVTYVYKGGPRNGKARTVNHQKDPFTDQRGRPRHPGPHGCVDEWKAAGMTPGLYVYLETDEQGHQVMVWREVQID